MKLIHIANMGNVCRFVFKIFDSKKSEITSLVDIAFPFDLHLKVKEGSILIIEDNKDNKDNILIGMSFEDTSKIIKKFQGTEIKKYDPERRLNPKYQAKLLARRKWYAKKKTDMEWLDSWREYQRNWKRKQRARLKGE